jgi:hypothetical protein
MGRLHHWYYLKGREGRPIVNANLNLYIADTKTEATVYESTAASAAIDQSTWLTGTSGFFEFYIGDQFEEIYTGYSPSIEFDLQWSASAARYSDGIIPSGVIEDIQLLPKIFTVNEALTDSTRNKMVSNFLAYKWDQHPDQDYSLEPHEIEPVDVNDSTDTTMNKVVNDDLMNRLVSFPIVSAGLPTINTSGALLTQQWIYPSAWSPSGDTYVTADINTNLIGRNQPYPIVQIYDTDTGDMIIPVRVTDIDDENMRIVMASGFRGRPTLGPVNITVLGEIRPRTE